MQVTRNENHTPPVVVLFFSQLLSALPQPVLAAVVLVAVVSLVRLSALRHLWRSDGHEFVIAMVATFGVLGQGLQPSGGDHAGVHIDPGVGIDKCLIALDHHGLVEGHWGDRVGHASNDQNLWMGLGRVA